MALFRELEFSSLLPRLPGGDGESGEEAEARESGGGAVDYHTVRDEGALEAMIAEVREAGYFAFDTETTSLNAMMAGLVGDFPIGEARGVVLHSGRAQLGAAIV